MLGYYKLSGVNAVIALVINLIILLGMMAYVGATMTLPGIAGFILTMGMGVDSNVLIFERIKEELAANKGARAAVAASFDRVFWTLLDTHVASLISAAFLFQFGTGPIRGFRDDAGRRVDQQPVHVDFRVEDAVRVRPVARGRQTRKPSASRSLHADLQSTNYDFVRWRWHAIALSVLVILAGAATIWSRGLPLGVEFAGGTIVIVKFEQATPVEQVRAAVSTLPRGRQRRGRPGLRRGRRQHRS